MSSSRPSGVGNISDPLSTRPNLPAWVTLPEASFLTGVPEDHLHRLIDEGALSARSLWSKRTAEGPLVLATQELVRTGLLVSNGPEIPGHAVAPTPLPARRQRHRLASPRTLQIALGALWLLDGLLQLQPRMFTHAFLSEVILPASSGQPPFVARPMLWAAHLASPQIALWNGLFAAVQIAIGVGLLWRRTVKPALALSFAWALGVWWFGEGLGGMASGSASLLTGAPGAVILYVALGLALWPADGDNSGTPKAGLLGATGAKLMWSALWIGGAVLSVLPTQRAPGAISDVLTGNAEGAPAFLASVERALSRAAAGRGFVVAVALAVIEVAIGLGVFFPSRARAFLALGIGVSLAFWAVGQNFGELFTGTATDPNAGPLFVLIGVALLPAVSLVRPKSARSGARPVRIRRGPPARSNAASAR
jgi:hypothetical protein